MISLTFLRLVLSLGTLLSFCSGRMILQHKRESPPTGFLSDGPADHSQPIILRLALAPKNIQGLEAKLHATSDPSSEEYGKFLNQDEIKSFLEPSALTKSVLNDWATSNGLYPNVISPNNDWVSFNTTVAHANELFDASYMSFTEAASGKKVVRTLSFSLQENIVDHVVAVFPATSFTRSNSQSFMKVEATQKREMGNGDNGISADSNTTVPASCNSMQGGIIVPSCLQTLYGIPSTPATQKNNTLLVTGFVDQFPQRLDLEAFLVQGRPDMDPNTTYVFQSLDGGQDPQNVTEAGEEADLDVEYTIGLATGVPTTFLSVGGDFNSPDGVGLAIVDTITFLQQTPNPPSVVSTSYAQSETDIDPALLKQLCNGFMSLGARGISMIFASGDGGVRGNHDDLSMCANNTFIPTFPGSCPYVTVVGSTWGIAPEVAIPFSGGGFSNVFPRPAYQDKAIPSFLQTVPRDFAGIFNRSGRGYPDVATQGANFGMVFQGAGELVNGTSASTPTFASIIALINDRLVEAGKPVLGFLNPWIYSKAEYAFTDITEGKNSGAVCPSNSTAFSAIKSWDAVTGLGTPKFDALLEAAGLKALPKY